MNRMLEFLKPLPAKIRGLRWKLTFSYILVTSAALVVSMVVALLVLAQFVHGRYQQSASSLLQETGSEVWHDLANRDSVTNDLGSLSGCLDAGYNNLFLGAVSINIPDLGAYSVVIDPSGQVLAICGDATMLPRASLPSTDFAIKSDYFGVDDQGQIFSICGTADVLPRATVRLLSTYFSPDRMSIVRLANRSHANDKPIVFLDQQHTLYGALPLFNSRRERLGVLLTVHQLPGRGQIFMTLFLLLWPALALVACTVSLVGALFGSLMSHWFVRRFMKVTRATSSWSQGDFSLVITDRSVDEFGVMTRQLNQMARELECLIRERQDMAMLEERNRVARDLHDSLKQQIFASIMQVWSVQALLDTNISAVREQLGIIEQLLEQAQQELSVLIHQLRPVILADRRFSEALQGYCMQWAQRQNIVLDLDLAEVDLSLSAEETLFRITQEALANVARHSKASLVQVQLTDQQEQVVLSITDNGQGFDLEQVRDGGIGLHSMRERMDMLGGTLSVISQCGHGTSICATYIKGKKRTQAAVFAWQHGVVHRGNTTQD